MPAPRDRVLSLRVRTSMGCDAHQCHGRLCIVPVVAHSRAMTLLPAAALRGRAGSTAVAPPAQPVRGRRRHRDRRLPRLARAVRARRRWRDHRGHGRAGAAAGAARVGWSFSLLFVVVSLPFVVLAVRGKGWAFTGALGRGGGAGVELLGAAAAPARGGRHRAAVRGASWATCWPASASSWCSGTGRAWAASTSSRCSARSGSAGGPGYVQMALDVAVVLAFAAVSHDLALDPGIGRGGRAAQPRHRDEPPCARTAGRRPAPRRSWPGAKLFSGRMLRHMPQR